MLFVLTGQYYITMLTKRDAILDSATRLFSKKPYHLVAMDDIAKKAKVAKGTLYYHFKSKEDLYVALLQEGIDNLLLRLKTESSGMNALENLQLFITRLAEFFIEKKDFFEVLKREEGNLFSKKLKNCFEKACSVKELLHTMLTRGIADGHLRSNLDVQATSQIVLGMIKSSVNGTIEAPKLADTIFDILLYGIKK